MTGSASILFYEKESRVKQCQTMPQKDQTWILSLLLALPFYWL